MRTEKIELYGRLKDLFGDSVEIGLPEGASARDLLGALGAKLGEAGLLAGSAVATESEVLHASAELPRGRKLAVLPPVCGG